MPDRPRFDFCISNPPYQANAQSVKPNARDTSQQQVVNIFQHFQQVGETFAMVTAMVYPGGRWLQKGGKGAVMTNFANRVLTSPHLVAIHWFDHDDPDATFGTVRIAGGTSIVIWDATVNNGGHFVFNGVVVPNTLPILPTDPHMVSIIEKVVAEGFPSLHERVSSRTVFGVESDFTTKHPDRVRWIGPAIDTDVTNAQPPADMTNPVLLLTNDIAGSAGRNHWYWISRADLPRGHEFIDTFKLVIQSAQFAHQPTILSNAMVLDSGTAFGRSKIALGMFYTRTEVDNFANFVKTRLVAKLFQQSSSGGLGNVARFVPDLEDWTNNNPIFTVDEQLPQGHSYRGLDLDHRLYVLFGLDDADVTVVEQR